MKNPMRQLFSLGLIPDWLDRIFHRSVTPLIRFFSLKYVNPNWLTTLGFLQSVAAAVLIAKDELIWGGILVGTAGIFDYIDGKVAALTGKVTRFGAILDTVLDRYSDAALCLGIIVFYSRGGHRATAMVTVLALLGSLMTSYIKSVGTAQGFRFRVGALRRQERVTLIFAGLIFSFAHRGVEGMVIKLGTSLGWSIHSVPVMPLAAVVYFLAVFTNFTALQRFFALRKMARAADSQKDV